MPEAANQQYIVADAEGRVGCARLRDVSNVKRSRGRWNWDPWGVTDSVTHWMPLPEAPKP